MKKDDDKVKKAGKSSVNFADLGRVGTPAKNEKAARCDDKMLDELKEIVNDYRGKDYHVIGEIPERKLLASTDFHGVDSKDTVLVLLDSTIMGSAENGMSITLKGIYWKNMWAVKTQRNSYTWKELNHLVNRIEIQGDNLVFEHEVQFYVPANYPELSLLNLIKELISFFKDTYQSAPSKDEVINQNIAKSEESKVARFDDNMFDELMEIINAYHGKDYHVRGEIPQRKLLASTDFHGVDSKDTVLVLLDSTVMGSAENGMSITLKGIYWNNMWAVKTRRNYYTWSELSHLVNQIKIQGGHLVFENEVEFYIPANYPELKLLSLIKELTNFFIEPTQDYKDTYQSAVSAGINKHDDSAITLFSKATKQNDAESQYKLGLMYKNGNGATEDANKATEWFLKAAEQNDTNSQYELGEIYMEAYMEHGKDAKNLTQAEMYLRKAAEQGHAGAQAILGLFYEEGIIDDNGQGLGMFWLRKAAEQGNADAKAVLKRLREPIAASAGIDNNNEQGIALFLKVTEQNNAEDQYNLGMMYRNGKGATKSATEALKWFCKSAEQDNANGQAALAFMYEHGEGVVRDEAKAIMWYQKAARKGDKVIQKQLSQLMEKILSSFGNNQNNPELTELFHKAIEQNDVEAQCTLATLYGKFEDAERAVMWYRKAAEHGNAIAQCGLGFMYSRGEGVAQDQDQAVAWCRKAEEQGNAMAQAFLGRCYESGIGVEKDEHQALALYQKAAEQGAANAQFALGRMYELGTVIAKNITQAMDWYNKAAEQGNEDAQFWLGFLYWAGEEVKQDRDKAKMWLYKAAEQGNEDAQKILDSMLEKDIIQSLAQIQKRAEEGDAEAQYELGIGFANAENYTQAIIWLRKAVEQNHAEAQYNLAVIYRSGYGVAKDMMQAIALFNKAAEQGFANAQYNLGLINMQFEDYNLAMDWFRKAAEQGHPKAQNELGIMYHLGTCTPKDMTQAMAWYHKAAEQGDANAQNELGTLYIKLQEYDLAMDWFRKAAEQEHATAQFNLGAMYEQYSENVKQAAFWYHKAAEQGYEDAIKALRRLLTN